MTSLQYLFYIRLFYSNYCTNHIKMGELGGLCSTNGDKRKYNMVFVGISEAERLLENLGVDKRIILKLIK